MWSSSITAVGGRPLRISLVRLSNPFPNNWILSPNTAVYNIRVGLADLFLEYFHDAFLDGLSRSRLQTAKDKTQMIPLTFVFVPIKLPRRNL